ncbi:uncharacterized protein LOC103314387 [Tribolium castaneum]|uniref:Kinetochore protein NDC80 n=1 Tax=Tribolium castaneum TaxID=7070 RepID=D6X3H1_TRICA|nr:PREDICTED: kinetochore protein ndc80 [Tribolium castaneum]EEZ97419.2 hypothetical protein TcasGA2_TC011249 [Tribolium castaneum]|eukprot:XP_008198559.1 PREDICTED: kinetochore protein ndc80 [Tribolium castaneum]
MYRRSNSSSQLPVPNRSRSKSSVSRVSAKDDNAKRFRANSMDRTLNPPLKRSTSSSNLRRPSVTPSVSYKKSTVITPTLNSGLKRSNSNLTTPRSRSKSPYKIGSAINDKKWVSDQYAKVLRFLREHPNCPEHLPNTIKPPTINSFVAVFNLLFKEIDPRFEVNTTNYKDIVLNTLKIYQFPGNISLSLLKTVNTMHAWPQVMGILGWLVDLVTYITQTNVNSALEQDPKYQKVECVTNYVLERYQLYNNNDDQEIADQAVSQELVKVLDIDDAETKRQQEEVIKLEQLKELRLEQINEQKNKNEMLDKEITQLQEETESFYQDREQREEASRASIESLRERKEKLVTLIKMKCESVESLKVEIKNQPCAIEERNKILEHIEAMKRKIDLKKEKIKTQKNIELTCHSKLKEAKNKVENEVYRLNNSLMKLTVVKPELKLLHLDESCDFSSAEFRKKVQNLPAKIKSCETMISDEITSQKTSIAKMKTEISTLEEHILSNKQLIETLTEKEISLKNQIRSLNEHLEEMVKQRKEEEALFKEKMKKMEQSAPPLVEIKQNIEQLKKIKQEKEEEHEKHKYQALEFFTKLESDVSNYVEKMNAKRNQVLDQLATCLQQTATVQQSIIDDMLTLEEIKKS